MPRPRFDIFLYCPNGCTQGSVSFLLYDFSLVGLKVIFPNKFRENVMSPRACMKL